MMWQLAVLSTAAIAISISIDAFATSFAYGCKKIKIPMLSAFIINFICTATIVVSFLFGTILVQYITEGFATGLAFTILFILGFVKLFDSITKSIIRKYTQFNKEINLSIFNLKLLMRLYADPEIADVDVSKSISPREAVVLAVSLSLDGLAVGLGAAMIGVNIWILIAFTLIADFAALLLGSLLGNKAANKLRFNISWLAGVILIGLAFMQLL